MISPVILTILSCISSVFFDDATGVIEVFEPNLLARAKDLKES